MSWLDETLEALASAGGLPPADLALPPEVAREILDLARLASHASGERTNAPLLCYSLGIAVGRGADLRTLGRAVRERGGETGS